MIFNLFEQKDLNEFVKHPYKHIKYTHKRGVGVWASVYLLFGHSLVQCNAELTLDSNIKLEPVGLVFFPDYKSIHLKYTLHMGQRNI